MAFNTKLNLSNRKMYQGGLDTLDLSGTTIIDGGFIGYLESPDFTQLPYNGDGSLITKKYVDDMVSGATSGGINKATNGLSKDGVDTVALGGILTKKTTIDGDTNTQSFELKDLDEFEISVDGASILFKDDSGLLYGSDYSSNFTDRSLVDYGFVVGLVDEFEEDYLDVLTDGITGATNGLTVIDRVVKLGGEFTETVNLFGDEQYGLNIDGMTGVNLSNIGGFGISLDDSVSVVSFTDGGFKYGSDYSSNFTDRSLVDKAYVDAFSYGITPKTSVIVATTENITLSNIQTIDGVLLSEDDRVLVKNQITTTENGIYVVVDGGAWTRSTDFDFTPESETRLGDLVPVLQGDSNNNTVWALTTYSGFGNPIGFTQFSKLVDVVDGNGIAINNVGGNKEISIDLDTDSGMVLSPDGLKLKLINNSGLDLDSNGLGISLINNSGLLLSSTGLGIELDSQSGLDIGANGLSIDLATNSGLNTTNGLSIDSSIAGTGLTLTNGVLSVNVGSGISGNEIPVKINGTNGLVIDEDDLPSISETLTGATNGLSVTNKNVVLGGTIETNTTISGDGSKPNLTIDNLTNLTLSGSTTSLGGDVKLIDTPDTGTQNVDKFLVRDSSGNVNQIDFSYANLQNNKYVFNQITTSATLTNQHHVVLVNGTGITITLPTLTAQDSGHVYKIKDISGDAYANPITISGTIDGQSNGIINTDYGALELMFVDGIGWITLSFIN